MSAMLGWSSPSGMLTIGTLAQPALLDAFGEVNRDCAT